MEQQALSVVSDFVNALQKGNQTRLRSRVGFLISWPGSSREGRYVYNVTLPALEHLRQGRFGEGSRSGGGRTADRSESRAATDGGVTIHGWRCGLTAATSCFKRPRNPCGR